MRWSTTSCGWEPTTRDGTVTGRGSVWYEYNEQGTFPELKFDLSARKKDASVTISAYHYDRKNIFGHLNVQKSDRITFDVDYISMIRNYGQDQLANLETREWLGDHPGGKSGCS